MSMDGFYDSWLQSQHYALTKSTIPLGFVTDMGPITLPPYTLRFKFDPSYTSTPPLPADHDRTITKGTWTKVQGVTDNLWDYTYENSDWSYLFHRFEENRPDVNYYWAINDSWLTECEIVDSGDLSGVTNWQDAFGDHESVYDAHGSGSPYGAAGGIIHLKSVRIPSVIKHQYYYNSNFSPFAHLDELKSVELNRVEGYVQRMFYCCTALEDIHIHHPVKAAPGVSGVDATLMFAECHSLTDGHLLIRFEHLTNASNMFADTGFVNETPYIDMSEVTSTYCMFASCTSLVTPSWYDTSSCINMAHMFDGCTSLTSVPLYDTSHVTGINSSSQARITGMADMFQNCSSLVDVPLFDTSNVVIMADMFYGCTSLETIPNFNSSKVEDFAWFARNCSSLKTVPALDVSSAQEVYYMFYNCTNVESGSEDMYIALASLNPLPEFSTQKPFTNCGTNTVSGTEELSHIPTEWGGTATVPVRVITEDLAYDETLSSVLVLSGSASTYYYAQLVFVLPTGRKAVKYGNPYVNVSSAVSGVDSSVGFAVFGFTNSTTSTDSISPSASLTRSGNKITVQTKAVTSVSGASTNTKNYLVVRANAGTVRSLGDTLLANMKQYITVKDWPMTAIY